MIELMRLNYMYISFILTIMYVKTDNYSISDMHQTKLS